MTTPAIQTRPRLVEVSPELAGQRIDNFLLRILNSAPRSMVYRILRQGQVRVNRGRIKPDYRLQTGDVVRVPPVRLEPVGAPGIPPGPLMERVRDAVLMEDRDLLVLNKPAGIAVHKGSGVDFGVIECLRTLRPDIGYLELAHRLDRETSGCLLLAKNSATLRAVHRALGSDDANKRYLALVRGRWHNGSVRVALPLRKNRLRGNERMVEIDAEGRPATSLFEPLKAFPRASLVEVRIVTGRTHQIRVHAAHLGHPVAGDSKYGDAGFNQAMKQLGLRRMFLHAHELSLRLDEGEIAMRAPLDDELKQVLDNLTVQG
jgi:23S rRNA pseudouridine955/2504/2580 synthase